MGDKTYLGTCGRDSEDGDGDGYRRPWPFSFLQLNTIPMYGPTLLLLVS